MLRSYTSVTTEYIQTSIYLNFIYYFSLINRIADIGSAFDKFVKHLLQGLGKTMTNTNKGNNKNHNYNHDNNHNHNYPNQRIFPPQGAGYKEPGKEPKE